VSTSSAYGLTGSRAVSQVAATLRRAVLRLGIPDPDSRNSLNLSRWCDPRRPGDLSDQSRLTSTGRRRSRRPGPLLLGTPHGWVVAVSVYASRG
jgi:hypothetical protein